MHTLSVMVNDEVYSTENMSGLGRKKKVVLVTLIIQSESMSANLFKCID